MRAKREEEAYQGATFDDLACLLKELIKSISGNEDDTLLSQMKLARQDTNDGLEKLRLSLDKFMKKMAKSNSQALNGVILDFNAKIDEQFGGNFKELNHAVGKTLEWQERYRDQMKEMIKQQTITAVNMGRATDRYTRLVEDSEAFKVSADQLRELLTELNVQRQMIQDSILALGKVLETTKSGLPDLENKIVELVGKMSKGIEGANAATISLVTSANQEMNSHVDKIAARTLEMFGREMASISHEFVEDYTPVAKFRPGKKLRHPE